MKFINLFKIFVSLIPLTGCSVNTALPVEAAEDKTITDISETNVLEDLSSIKEFNKENYAGSKINFIYLAENKYNPKIKGDYSLYAYFYINPYMYDTPSKIAHKFDFDVSHYLSFKDGETVSKKEIVPVSYMENFYKFKVSLSDTDYVANQEVRSYTVCGVDIGTVYKDAVASGGVEILNQEVIHLDLNKTYKYEGYSANILNPAAKSSLKLNVTGDEVLSLKVTPGYFRNQTSNKGFGWKKDIFYVWFNIPNYILEKYGELHGIHFERELYKLHRMYHINDKYDMYPHIVMQQSDVDWLGNSLDPITNKPLNEGFPKERLFQSKNWNDAVSASDVEARVKSKGIKNFTSTTFKEAYAEKNIENDTFDLLGIDSKDMSTWEWLAGILGGYVVNGESYKDVKIFEKVQQEITAEENKYLVNELDIKHFNECYGSSKKNNETMYMFRFDVVDTFTSTLKASWTGTTNILEYFTIGYAFDTSCIMNFKIIDLTFAINGSMSVIPVLMDAVDIFTGGDAPLMDTSLADGFRTFLIVLASIVGLILIGVIVKLFFKITKVVQQHNATKAMKEANKKNKKGKR